MATDPLFASLVLSALGCLAILGIGRALMLSARGAGSSPSTENAQIDRDRPGALVTGGIFGRSRNPVYLGLALLAFGVFLVLGPLVLLLLAIVFLVYFQVLIRRGERFLAEHYGNAYREYARSVGRWWTWRLGDGARRTKT